MMSSNGLGTLGALDYTKPDVEKYCVVHFISPLFAIKILGKLSSVLNVDISTLQIISEEFLDLGFSLVDQWTNHAWTTRG